MTPNEAVQKGWEAFERLIHEMDSEDYAEACEILASIAEAQAEAVREDIKREAEADD